MSTIEGKFHFRAVNAENAPMRVAIEYKLKDEKALSIMGDLNIGGKNNPFESGGQNREDIEEYFLPFLKENKEFLEEILSIWERWHLNDMKAGCEHQRAARWDKLPIDSSKPLDSYGKHYKGQNSPSWNMLTWIRPEEHPRGLLTVPCPECGYRYGTAWLTEPLPQEIIDKVKGWQANTLQ